MEDRPHNHSHSGGIVWPALLIGVGVVLLLQQFGYIHWSIWEIAIRLWPLLIVGVGVELLIGRRSVLGSLLSLVIILGLFFGAIWIMGIGPVASSPLVSQSVALPKAAVSHASVRLTPATGSLEVDALAAGGVNGLEASIQDSNWSRITTSSADDARQGDYRIGLSGPENYLVPSIGNNRWRVHLAGDIPALMKISMGAGETTLHLEQLTLDNLDVSVGAGQITIFLPEKSIPAIHISVGTGQATVHLAAGAAISIRCTTGVGNCVLPGASGVWSQTYTSPDYNSATDHSNMEISVGVGSVNAS